MELQADNPYQAPSAPLAIDEPRERSTLLYAPAAWKFLLLSLCTFNLYLIIWFYRNWVAIRRARQVKLSPVARSIFSGLTAYFCFEQMEEVLAKRLGRKAPELHGGLVALIYFVLSALSRLPEPFWAISLLAPLPVLWVNQRLRAANLLGGEAVSADERLSWGAWILVALGVCLFALAMVGLLLLLHA